MRRGVAALALGLGMAAAAEAAPSACITCHADRARFPSEVVTAFAGDVHAAVGLSCHDCHGGNSDPALAGDLEHQPSDR